MVNCSAADESSAALRYGKNTVKPLSRFKPRFC